MAIIFSGVALSVASGGSIYGDFSGPVVPTVGTSQRNFTSTIKFYRLVLHTFVNVSANVVVTINVNGLPVSVITLAAGTNTQINPVSIIVNNGDYMTTDVTSGSCSDLSVRLDY